MADNAPSAIAGHARVEALANGRYHADREAFLDTWRRGIAFLIIVLGAAAIVDVTAAEWRWTLGFAVTILASADLVMDLSAGARTHGYLRRQYFEIVGAFETGELDPAIGRARMMALAADEPPPYLAAHAVAENWATRAVLGPDAAVPCLITRPRRLLRHYWRQDGHPFGCQ